MQKETWIHCRVKCGINYIKTYTKENETDDWVQPLIFQGCNLEQVKWGVFMLKGNPNDIKLNTIFIAS